MLAMRTTKSILLTLPLIWSVVIYSQTGKQNNHKNLFNTQVSQPCPGVPSFEYGGQTYNTVLIGDQCWMKENLNIGTRINGSQEQTNNGTIEKYCYNDAEDSCNVYGGLYQWDEMMQYVSDTASQGICPENWHVPTSWEFWQLINLLGGDGVAGGHLKEAGTSHWNPPNTGASNSSGFTALPAGDRYWGGGSFMFLHESTFYWLSSDYNNDTAWYVGVYYNSSGTSYYNDLKTLGFSIRCIKDESNTEPLGAYFEATPVIGTAPLTVQFSDTSSGNPTSWQWDFQNDGVIDSYSQNPSYTYNDPGLYSVKLIISNGQEYDTCLKENYITAQSGPCPDLPSFVYGGQTYNTVLIGNQCWMKENLNIGTRIDGNQNQTNNSVIEKYCYNNNDQNCNTYGGLYQWDELMQYSNDTTTQGICPDGWHIPTDAEWDIIINYLNGEAVAGGKMKATGTIQGGDGLWQEPNTGATNESGFTATPAGKHYSNSFLNLSAGNFIWSSTESNNNAWYRSLGYSGQNIFRSAHEKSAGFSVRCIKNELSTIKAGFSANPLILPLQDVVYFTDTSSGNPTSWQWDFQNDGVIDSYTQNPTWIYTESGIFSVKLIISDGQNYDTTYKENYIRVYQPCPDQPTVEYEGQIYTTVLIGSSCWLRENLNVGTMINVHQDQTDNSVIEKYCYDNLESNCDIYGGLYQWDEIMQYTQTPGVQGICPDGWHIPQDNEWTILSDFLGGGTVAGGKMKESGYEHWNPPNTAATNITGYSGLPGGFRYTDGVCYDIKDGCWYWSSDMSNSTYSWGRELYHDMANLGTSIYRKKDGFSIRCIKDSTQSSFSIQTSANPTEGGSTEGDGEYSYGEEVTVTATPNQDWNFINWTENSNIVSTNPDYTFIVSQDRTLTAHFSQEQLYSVITTSNPSEGGVTSGDGTFLLNDEVTVSASANLGWEFVNWTENTVVVSTDVNYSFLVTSNRNLVANFAQKQYSVSLTPVPSQGGSVSGGGTYLYGIETTVSANPAPDWNFINWTENDIIVSTEQDYTFTVTGDRELNANFSQSILYSVITSVNPEEGGYTTGGGTYEENSTVTVTAVSNPGWKFNRWLENDLTVSTDSSFQFIIAGNRFLEAEFSLDEALLVSVYASDDSICNGDSLYLSSDITGGTGSYNYSWYSDPAGFIAHTSDASDLPEANAWYILSVNDGESTEKDSVYIKVLQAPPAHIVPKGNPVYVLICPDSGYVYQWYHDKQPIHGATGQFYYPGESGLSTGEYKVIVTNDLECSTFSESYHHTTKSLVVYPNPNDGYFTIIFDLKSSKKPVKLEMYDIYGKTILEQKIIVGEGYDKYEQKISCQKGGVYLARIILDDNSVLSKKIIVIK